jgi:hypothetical protein
VLDMAINQAVPVAVSFATANVAAAVVSMEAHDGGRFVAIIGGVTVAITSICGMVSFLAPRVAQVIKEAVPPIVEALDTVRKQREELAKGSYAEQIDDLKGLLADLKADNARAKAQLDSLKADNARVKENLDEAERIHAERAALVAEQAAAAAERVEAANRKLHDIRDKLSADIVHKDARILELEHEIQGLRDEVRRLVQIQGPLAAEQDRKIAANAAEIAQISASAADIAQVLQGRTPDPDAEPFPRVGPDHGDEDGLTLPIKIQPRTEGRTS